MILVYTDNSDFYNEILPSLPIISKQILDYDILQKSINDAELLILDGEKRQNGAMSFIKECSLLFPTMPPTIIITNKKEEKWLSVWSGATEIIQKPIDTFELINTIKRNL